MVVMLPSYWEGLFSAAKTLVSGRVSPVSPGHILIPSTCAMVEDETDRQVMG